MPSATFELFRQAIRNKQQIVCMYQGEEREVCPHAVGWKRGIEQAMTWQFAGGTSKGPIAPPGNWRCLELSQVRDAVARDGDWHTGTNHSERQRCIDQVDTEVDY